jgi:hypothetical protein
VGVANHIKKLNHDFLLGGLSKGLKFHLVSWSKVCPPIFEGGLSVRNLLRFNYALLGKWLWCYVY